MMIEKLLRFFFKKTISKIESSAEKRGAAKASIDVMIEHEGESSKEYNLLAGDVIKFTKTTNYFGDIKTMRVTFHLDRIGLK